MNQLETLNALLEGLQRVSEVEFADLGAEAEPTPGLEAAAQLRDAIRSMVDILPSEVDAEVKDKNDSLGLDDPSGMILALEQRIEALESAEGLVDESDGPGDTIPEIVDETGVAGTSMLFARDDTVPKFKLRKNGTAQDISGLMVGSASSGFQMRIAAAADEDAERAATVHANPTVEIVPDGGVQVKFSTSTDATLEAVADGLAVKLLATGAITAQGDGIGVNYGNGLDIVANALVAKADPAAGNLVSVGAAGILGTAPKLDDCQAPDDNTDLNATTTKHGLLPKLGGGTSNFLRADGTWAAPPAASPLEVGDEKRAYRTDDHTTNGFVWKLLDGRTIGDSSSGATWASADAEDLFTFLWDHVSDTYCPVSGGRGASAAADWAASKTLTIPDSRGDGSSPCYPVGAGGSGPAVGETGGSASVNPGGTLDSAATGLTVDSGVANIYINSNWSIELGNIGSYVGVEDTGHDHSVTDPEHTHGATNLTVAVKPPYLAAGVFILAKVP